MHYNRRAQRPDGGRLRVIVVPGLDNRKSQFSWLTVAINMTWPCLPAASPQAPRRRRRALACRAAKLLGVTAFRVGQASRPGKKKNYYNGGYARDCYLDQA